MILRARREAMQIIPIQLHQILNQNYQMMKRHTGLRMQNTSVQRWNLTMMSLKR